MAEVVFDDQLHVLLTQPSGDAFCGTDASFSAKDAECTEYQPALSCGAMAFSVLLQFLSIPFNIKEGQLQHGPSRVQLVVALDFGLHDPSLPAPFVKGGIGRGRSNVFQEFVFGDIKIIGDCRHDFVDLMEINLGTP